MAGGQTLYGMDEQTLAQGDRATVDGRAALSCRSTVQKAESKKEQATLFISISLSANSIIDGHPIVNMNPNLT